MIDGKYITLRAYKPEDVEIALKLINTMSIKVMLEGVNAFPFSIENQRQFIQSAMESRGPLYNFAIEEKSTGEYIGGCGINSYDAKNRTVVIGMWIAEKCHGKGYGSDTLRTLCKFIFDELNIHKIDLNYFSFNEKGRRCYDSVGFKEEGVRRKELFRFGEYHDIIEMGLFRDELILKD